MGKMITFWSPYIGQAKVTSSLCAVAGMFGMEYPELSIAISHIHRDSLALEEKLDSSTPVETRKELYKKTGISALKLNCRQAVLTSEKIRRSAVPLRMKSLYLYPYTEQEMDRLTYKLFTETLKNEFDIFFLDLENGKQELSLRFMKEADLVVVVLPQSPVYCKQFFEQEEWLKEKEICVLFGGYLPKSKYSRNFCMRKTERKADGGWTGAIPINTGFFDAMTEGKTLDYFFRNQLVGKKEENYEFIVQAKKAAEGIRKKLFFS